MSNHAYTCLHDDTDTCLPDDAGEGCVPTAGQLQDEAELARVPVQAPQPGAVLPEGEAHQVRQVMLPGRQDVQQRIVAAPERTVGICASHQVELRAVTEHLGGLVYPGVGLV